MLQREIIYVYKSTLEKKGAMTISLYNELRPVGTQPSVLYGLGKVHKATVNNIPKLRPILSAVNTPTYKLSQYLNKLMKPLTTNQYTAKDSFSFTEDIRKQDSTLSMASLDIDSLFTDIPLDYRHLLQPSVQGYKHC